MIAQITISTDHARFEVIDDINNILYVFVTIATLMEPEGPVRRHMWSTNHLLVLLDHSLRTGASKQVKIQNTCKGMHSVAYMYPQVQTCSCFTLPPITR